MNRRKSKEERLLIKGVSLRIRHFETVYFKLYLQINCRYNDMREG